MEPVHKINEWLSRDYGFFDGSLSPLWRIVWSHDEMEKRWMTHSPEGFELEFPEIAFVPKYRQWADNYFIMERALPVPENVETDLSTKWSYEPVWVFRDAQNNPLPPRYDACKMIIETVYKNAAGYVGARYKDPQDIEKDPKIAKEAKKARLEELKESLFGNETSTGDALAYHSGVTVPHGQTVLIGENNGSPATKLDE